MWRFFSSVRLAIILILILAVLGLVGSLVVQMPDTVALDPTLAESWLDNTARPIFGIATDFLAFLGIFDLFHSPLFLIAGGLLIFSIIICTLNRWKSLNSSFKPASVKSAIRLASSEREPDLIVHSTSENITDTLRVILEKKGYQPRQQNMPEGNFIVADKNRYSVWGSYLVHASLVLFILGYLLSSYFSFKDDAFIVIENTVRKIENGSDLSLELKSFEDEYWPDGTPKDYRSEVVVLRGDDVIAAGTVRVNHPLTVDNLKIYQSFYGRYALLKILDENQETIYDNPVLLERILESSDAIRPFGTFALEDKGIFGYLIGSSLTGQDAVISGNELRLELYSGTGDPLDWTTLEVGNTTDILGLTITLEQIKNFSGFQLRQDPGTGYIWTASSFLLVGLISVFYFPHRKLFCAIVDEGQKGKVWLNIRATKKQGVSQEVTDIITALRAQIEHDNGRDVKI